MPLDLHRVSMPEQPPEQRRRNFDEVALGYTDQDAQREAARCLQCKNPLCRKGCPVQVRIPEFIAALRQDDLEAAYEIITSTNSLPAVCGRVCPQEEQCELECVLHHKGVPVAIGRLERYVADCAMQRKVTVNKPPSNGRKVAVVGSGPAGLSCAGDLARMGYQVCIFEALHEPGGVLVYGIPEFRLPKDLVRQELDTLRALGVQFETNVVVGRTVDVNELMQDEGYQAVFLGSGAGLPRFMGIPGENMAGVYAANEYLTRINLMKAWKPDSQTPILRGDQVIVVGGGNVAMDAARSALRMGSKVTVVYRRSRQELPARAEEVHHAEEEGVQFAFLSSPIELLGEDNRVTGMRCVRMQLGETDSSGRRRPEPVAGTEHDLPADLVIVAVGTSPSSLLSATTPDLAVDSRHRIQVADDTMVTSLPGVYAGGDAVSGAATVIEAMGAGKKAARAIHQYIADLEQEKE